MIIVPIEHSFPPSGWLHMKTLKGTPVHLRDITVEVTDMLTVRIPDTFNVDLYVWPHSLVIIPSTRRNRYRFICGRATSLTDAALLVERWLKFQSSPVF